MDAATIIGVFIEHGLHNGMLIAFIIYFFYRDKRRDKEMDGINDGFDKRMNALLADGVRREDIMRSEFDKREKHMRQEAERRDNAFMRSLDGLNETMREMSSGIADMKNAFVKMDFRLQNIESQSDRRPPTDG